MQSEYWTRFWRRRANRRRVLGVGATAGLGAAGLALVGCGDDDDGEATATPGSGETPAATNTTAPGETPAATATPGMSVTRGGRYQNSLSNDPPTLDPYKNLTFLAQGRAATIYSRLFKFKSGPDHAYAAYEGEGDLAESYELADDYGSATINLRHDIKTHPKPPVDGRDFTSEDVKTSWERYTATSTNAGDFDFVEGVETPDDFTVVFKMAKPSATLISLLTSPQHFWVLPKEAGQGFDPEQDMIGTGPWVFDRYEVAQQISVDRFDGWHGAGPENLPYMDGVDWYIIPEYASRLTQFQGGNLDVAGVNSNDLLQLRDDMPDAKYSAEFRALMSFMYMSGPGDEGALGPNSLFKDPRVRQALSMALDRDTMTDLAYNVQTLKEAGFPASILWNSVFMPAGLGTFWVDPRSDDMGEAKPYYEYNPDEAKKLLDAAGFPLDQGIKLHTIQNVYGSDFDGTRDLLIAYLNDIGMDVSVEVEDYSSKYITQTFHGNFEGLAYGYQTPFTGPEGYLTRPFTENPNNHSKILDPGLIDIIEKSVVEFDPEARLELIHDVQRYASKEMFYVAGQNGANQGWLAAQGYMHNIADYLTAGYGPPTETDTHVWKEA